MFDLFEISETILLGLVLSSMDCIQSTDQYVQLTLKGRNCRPMRTQKRRRDEDLVIWEKQYWQGKKESKTDVEDRGSRRIGRQRFQGTTQYIG